MAPTFRIRPPMRKALLVAAAALAAAGVAGIARADSHDSLSGAGRRAAEARASEQALTNDIAAQSERIDGVEREIGGLQSEVTELETKLGRARARLAALERELAEKTRTIARARVESRVAQRHLNRRLVDIYTSGEPDLVSIALGAASVDELLDLLETRSRVLEADDDLVSRIKSLRARVARERSRTAALRERQAAETAQVELRVNERRSALASLIARRDSLERLRAARRSSLAAVRVDRQEWERQAAALAAGSVRVASITSAAPAEPIETAAPATGTSVGFTWPVRGTLTSPYGLRWGRLHAGLDIAAPAGTPVQASASGQVVYAGSMGGFGLLVVIQHPGGISTAYAHNSSLAVSVGQSVGQGQTIAGVGCTGSCSGNHVHFEVRVGGAPVDPMTYL